MAYVTKSYRSHQDAVNVVDALKSAGIKDSDISLISRSSESDDETYPTERDSIAGSAVTGAPGVGSTGLGQMGMGTAGLAGAGMGDTGMGTVADSSMDRPDAMGTKSGLSDHAGTGTSRMTGNDAAEDAAVGAASGGVLGAGAGLLAGLGMMAIPGLGPVVAAGWLAATAAGALAGAAAGGAAGGIVGALTEAGVPEADSHVYAENVRRGGAIVSVKVDEADRSRVDAIMDDRAPIDPKATGDEYRSNGWKGFDTAHGGEVPFNSNPPVI